MNLALKNEDAIRDYLLGRVGDEALLADYEELLFADEEFAGLAELVEDALVNDFVFGKLNEIDRADFGATLSLRPDRRAKVALARALREKANPPVAEKAAESSFFDSLRAFFRDPLRSAALAVVAIGLVVFAVILLGRPKTDELAELKTIYGGGRTTETRLSDFDYAPLAATRGATEEREKSRLRRIENGLLERAEKNPADAEAQHALGVFYLTQRKFAEAAAALEKAAAVADRDARVLNDLGSVYFEQARTEPAEKRLETLARALENFSRAVTAAPDFRPALFNRALCLQELRLGGQAKAAWNAYLEKDADSGWADEARKNLERLEQSNANSKTAARVLDDFLAAYRNRDPETMWIIDSQTREMVSGVWLADQLSRRFVDARSRGDDAAAAETIDALKTIGELEKTRTADFFVAEMAAFYEKADPRRLAELRRAKEFLGEGYKTSTGGDDETARALFERARQSFAAAGSLWEAAVAEHWIAFCDGYLKNLTESGRRFERLEKFAAEKKYRWLRAVVLYRLSTNAYFLNDHSESLKYDLASEKLMDEIGDTAGQNYVFSEIAASYYEIGELEKALGYAGRATFADQSYYASEKQTWRNQGNTSMILGRAEFSHAALAFALEHGEKAKSIADREYVFNSLRNVALGYAAVGDYDRARAALDESLRVAAALDDEKSRRILSAKSVWLFGQVERLAGNCPAALAKYDEALAAYRDFPEETVDLYRIHKGRLQCYQTLGETEKLRSELETARGLLEEYRAEIVEDENRNVFFDREQTVADIAVETALTGGDAAAAFELAEEAKARSLLDFMRGESSFDGKESRFATATRHLALAEIQARMPAGAQLVEYAVLPGRVAVWTIDRERFGYAETPVGTAELERKIDDFRRALIVEKENRDRIAGLGADLYRLLVAPVQSRLDPARPVCFVPDKALFRLPFGALFSKAGERFLVEELTPLYAPSASVFVLASENARRRENERDERLLSVGNPRFDAAENPSLVDLPAAAFEAEEIGRLYPNARLLTGVGADKASVLNGLNDCRVFHFAGHYVTNEISAPHSKLLLAGRDGALPLSELPALRLPALKLVVLSACGTSLDRLYRGEGAVGAARAFLAAGAPVVVASGWPVDSEATAALMIEFHRGRREKGLAVPEALRRAQLALLGGANERFRRPFYWAAFAPTGGLTNY
ncbi:MAG: CHAT domain-containing protein [Acidobacteria bacterium]|nr:CHAT domain-containing protein [Acidobacteriota bacterium]